MNQIAIFIVMFLLTGSAQSAIKATKSSKSKAQVLMLSEQEDGIEPYAVRYIITDRYLRNDDGLDNGDFTLLDRQKKVIYNVSRENKTVLVVAHQAVTISKPEKLKINISTSSDAKLPKIDNKLTLQLKFQVGNKVCNHYIVARNLMPKSIVALKEYRTILAGEHAKNLFKTPESQRDPCFTAFNIFNHSKHLEYGLVIRRWNTEGKLQQLLDFKKNSSVKNSLFELPKGYRHYNSGQVPSIKVPTVQAPGPK